VALWTSPGADGHAHLAVFDGRGNGMTTPGPDGHVHVVLACDVMLAPDRHTHELTARRAPCPSDMSEIERPSGSGRWGARHKVAIAGDGVG